MIVTEQFEGRLYSQPEVDALIAKALKEAGIADTADTSTRALFDKLCEVLGHQNLKYTPGRVAKLKRRLKTFSEKDIVEAAKAIAGNEYLMGDNPNGKKYGTIDYLIRNDEKLDEWLEFANGSGNEVDLSNYKF